MGISVRYYLVESSGKLRRLPGRVADAMTFGNDALPEFAGTTQRIVSAVVENNQGRPVRIVDARGDFWKFDDEGKIDKGLQESLSELMSFAFHKRDEDSKVVNLAPEIKRREFQEKHRWPVTKDLLDRIAADIWPGVHGPADEVSSVKGKAPKRPPLTYEARRALHEIEAKLSTIDFEISRLSEPSLKGLAFEANRTADFGEMPTLWLAIAGACERQRQILQRRRTGKGVWYAVLEIFFAENQEVMRSVLTVHEKCDGKEAAVQAARKLIVANADKFSDTYSIETHVYTDLEWTPEEI